MKPIKTNQPADSRNPKSVHPRLSLFLSSMVITFAIATIFFMVLYAFPGVRLALAGLLPGSQNLAAPRQAAAATASPSPTPSAPAPTVTTLPNRAEVTQATAASAGATTPTATPGAQTAIPTADPAQWQTLPIIPAINANARAIYLKGQALGNHANVFSKIGDCNSLPPYYLTYFDQSASAYDLGAYGSLQPAIVQFAGSFKRKSVAAGDGFNTSAVLSTLFTDPAACSPGESPLACEYRTRKPAFAIIAIGTDDYIAKAKFETNLSTILETTIKLGIVPILITKMDNANQFDENAVLAKLAEKYDIPLINLWRALQPLPKAGLDDNIHPSGVTDAFVFSPANLSRYGWPVRNLTILQGLNATWQAATQP